LNYTFEGLFGFTTNVPEIGTAYWFGVLNYLTCDFTPRLSGTTRLEFFDDVQGQRTGFAGLYTALTTGVSFRPRKDIIMRPEIRYDYIRRFSAVRESARTFHRDHGRDFSLVKDGGNMNRFLLSAATVLGSLAFLSAQAPAAVRPAGEHHAGRRKAELVPSRQGFTHTAGGNIDVAQPGPDTASSR